MTKNDNPHLIGSFGSTVKDCEKMEISGLCIGCFGSGAMIATQIHDPDSWLLWSGIIFFALCLMFAGEILEHRIQKQVIV